MFNVKFYKGANVALSTFVLSLLMLAPVKAEGRFDPPYFSLRYQMVIQK
jgi:hypothetical protein